MKQICLVPFFIASFFASNAQTKIQIFDKVLYYDGYGTKVDTPLPAAGVIRHKNYLYARKMTDKEINQMGTTLQMIVTVKASCDNYDRIGNVNMALVSKDSLSYDPKSVPRIELGRFITPFMNKNIMPDSVSYEFEINNIALLMKDTGITNHYNIWIELEIFGVPYAANTQVAGCGGRNDVFFGSLAFVTNTLYPAKSNNVLIPMAISQNFNNYQASATDTLGKTTRTFQINLTQNLTDASFYLITSNHGSNSGGEEYIRRNHFVYVDNSLVVQYKPGRTSCEPFRKYNTQGNGIYGSSPRTPAQWQSFSNWCPGDKIDIRRIKMGPMVAGNHTFKIEVPDAVFTGGQGNLPLSVYLQGKTSETIDNTSFLDTIVIIKNVYPNPANSFFTIETFGAKADGIVVYDALGRTVLNKRESFNSTIINTSNYRPGIYFVGVIKSGQIKYRKIMITR